MAILNFSFDFTGEVDVAPRIGRLICNDTLATITTAGYLNPRVLGTQVKPSDIIAVSYGTGANPIQANFMPVFVSNVITLVPLNPQLIPFSVTVGQAALASGGSVVLVPSYANWQFRIMILRANSGGTNFSGGGGDRLGQVTDGTTVYSVIPAASLQTLANAQWGVTALPNAASAADDTLTVAGASLLYKYSGGTTDYTAGSVVMSGMVLRVA